MYLAKTLCRTPFVPSRRCECPRLAQSRPLWNRRPRPSIYIAEAVGAPAGLLKTAPPAIQLTPRALGHLLKMRESKGDGMLLRMGVKSGGCSGLSYLMNFEEEGNIASSDTVMEFDEGFRLVCDAKSLLYLFGMSLDFSDELIGGGFKFDNPNAEKSCGCGKSFKTSA